MASICCNATMSSFKALAMPGGLNISPGGKIPLAIVDD